MLLYFVFYVSLCKFPTCMERPRYRRKSGESERRVQRINREEREERSTCLHTV